MSVWWAVFSGAMMGVCIIAFAWLAATNVDPVEMEDVFMCEDGSSPIRTLENEIICVEEDE
jgi:hypothetical protein